jgi:hypothetical protein
MTAFGIKSEQHCDLQFSDQMTDNVKHTHTLQYNKHVIHNVKILFEIRKSLI